VITSSGHVDPRLTWDLVADVRQLFAYPFMVNALEAGTVVAGLAGVIGWFMVLRRQSFTGHTVAVVGFPGAAGALLLGISTTCGFLVFALLAAAIIATVPSSGRGGDSTQSAVTGTVQATALAFGFWFSSLYGGFTGGANALLFGSFLGITTGQVQVLVAVAAAAAAVLILLGRPLLFASIDPGVAAARGLPVRALSLVFLLLLAAAAAEVAQITGTLLVFALLVVPAAAAQTMTARPLLGIALAVTIGALVTWAALFLAYYEPYPIGFFLTSLAFAAYLIAALVTRRRKRPVQAPGRSVRPVVPLADTNAPSVEGGLATARNIESPARRRR
jgi:zinc/manganese transport system permease protein